MGKTFDDYLSKGACNDGTQSNDRVSNWLREQTAHEKRHQDDSMFCTPYDWETEKKYWKAREEFDKFGQRGQATYDFSKEE